MYNILSEQVHGINLIGLESLIEIADITIKREGKNLHMTGEDIEEIQYAKVQEPRYRIGKVHNNTICFKSVYLLLSLELKVSKMYMSDYVEQAYFYIFENFELNVAIDSNKVYCKLDLSKAYFEVVKAHYSEIAGRLVRELIDSTILTFFYDKHRDILFPYMTRYEYPYEIPKDAGQIYLSTYMYYNDCYKIINNEHGVNIVTQDAELVPSLGKTSAIYRHENYLFVLRTNLLFQIDLIIIDIRRNLISIIESIVEEAIGISFMRDGSKTLNKNMLNCLLWFVYYLKKHNIFIFISNNHQYLLLVKADEIEKLFKDISMLKCGENPSEEGLVEFYNILELIIEAIDSYMGKIYKKIGFYMIEHYIDTKSDKLYLLVKYIVGKKKYICLLEAENYKQYIEF
jgi:hypothetical protein